MGGAGGQRQYKRSWKNYFLNLRYQLRFTLFMVALSAILMTGLGWWVMKEAKNATKVGVSSIQGNAYVDDAEKDKQIGHLQGQEDRLQMLLIGVGLVLCAGLFVYGIKMTHKVAGPLHKITLYFDKVKAGRYDKIWSLRKGDQLVSFFEHFREAHEALRKRQETEVERLREVISAADQANLGGKSPQLATSIEDMKQLLKNKEASLG